MTYETPTYQPMTSVTQQPITQLSNKTNIPYHFFSLLGKLM